MAREKPDTNSARAASVQPGPRQARALKKARGLTQAGPRPTLALNTPLCPPLFLLIKVNNAIRTKNFSAGTNNEGLR